MSHVRIYRATKSLQTLRLSSCTMQRLYHAMKSRDKIDKIARVASIFETRVFMREYYYCGARLCADFV